MLKSMEILINLMVPPALDVAQAASLAKSSKHAKLNKSKVTDKPPLAVNLDSSLNEWDKTKPGMPTSGSFTAEQLRSIFKVVTLPNGEKDVKMDLKGTPLEGHDDAFMKSMMELAMKHHEMKTGSSSRGN